MLQKVTLRLRQDTVRKNRYLDMDNIRYPTQATPPSVFSVRFTSVVVIKAILGLEDLRIFSPKSLSWNIRSQVVASILLKAASKGRKFSVVVLEGRLDTSGAKVAEVYANVDIPTTVMMYSVVGYVM